MKKTKSSAPSASETITAAIEPPTWLALSAGALDEWEPIIKTLAELGTARHCDLRALGLLCEILADEKRYRNAVAIDGLTISGVGESRKAHPGLKILETTRAQACRLLADFGLTPRGRVQVKIEPTTPEDDEWADFF